MSGNVDTLYTDPEYVESCTIEPYRFTYNVDYEGPIVIEQGDQKVTIPFKVIKTMVANYVRMRRDLMLADMTTDQVLGSDLPPEFPGILRPHDH